MRFAISVRWLLGVALVVILGNPVSALAAFGLTTNANNYSIDTGAGLVFKIRRDNPSSTTSPGDIMSLVYKGVEYQDQTRGSQVNSGFDFIYNYTNLVSVTPAVYGTNYIKITVVCGDPANSSQGLLTHYYIARNGDPYVYMATYFNKEPETQALCRYIIRSYYNLLPHGPAPSDLNGNTGAVESGDIFGMADGTTRSKHYSNHRLIDWSYTGASGNGVGLWMVRDSNEGASGGPFYRSLINQGDGAGSDQEIYEIVNYGEAQTEATYRVNILNGLYALVFTGGGAPPVPLDYSWLQTAGLDLLGFVPDTERGAIKGTVSGVPTNFQAAVGLANANAQYWTIADTNGNYTTPLMIPGSYTATLYRQELAVASTPVVVTAGVTNTLDLASTLANPATIFKIGQWDGTPAGFLNADKMTFMHPSDSRMSSWILNSNIFNVGTDSISTFPAICMRGTNAHNYIKFNLTAGQIGNLTFKIGATVAGFGGRPDVKINGTDRGFPAAPSQPSTRTWTIGSYRGNNITWTWTLPSSSLVIGQNTLDISPVSGTTDSGPWLSAGWVYDCLELDGSGGPTAPLGPPSGLTATRGGGAKVAVKWSAVNNATSYTVSRANVSGGPYTFIAVTGAVTNYLDVSATNGNTHYYVVTALNANGESGYSAEATASGNVPVAVISQIQASGSTLLANASSGPADWPFYVLTATNLNSGVWVPVATNQFDASGDCSLTISNAIDADQPQMFYRLQLQ